MKKVLAIILSMALVLSFMPMIPALATTDAGYAYAEKLNAEVGKELINHDYSAMTELPADLTGSATLSATNAVNGEKTLSFGNYWNGDGRNARIDVHTDAFVAKVTMVVDNVQTQTIGGTFAFRTVGKNASKTEEIASYVRFGLPDRTVGVPYPGGLIYSDEFAEYGFKNVSGVTPFIAESGIEEYTFYAYSLNGTNYYVNEDGTLMCASAHKTGVTDATVIEFFCEYGIAYVTELVVNELKEVMPEDPFENSALKENSGYVTGDVIYKADFAEFEAGTTPDGWTFNSASINKGSGDSAGRNVLKLRNDTGGVTAVLDLESSNFAAIATVGIDYTQILSGTLVFGILDANGNFGASWGLGLPKRSQEQVLKAGKSLITDNVTYNYPAAGAYEYNVDGYTTVKMVIYFYEGTLYAYWPDGTFVGSIQANSNADFSGGAKISLGNDWGSAYIHDLAVYEVAPYVEPVVNELVENSGFIADELVYHADFKNFAAGETPEGWTFNNAKIMAGTSESANRNVLRLRNDTGYVNAVLDLGSSNFAAVATVGIDYAQALSGSLAFGVLDANCNFGASWSLGLPKRSDVQMLKAGKSMITNNATYKYPAEGAYEYNVDGYTTVKMVIYFYEGTLYAYWPDGTFVGSIKANGSADFSSGAKISLGNDWGSAYIHDLKVYEIIPNSFKVDSSYIAIGEDNAPLMNFNFSFDDSYSEVIASDTFEFGAVVTVQDTAVTAETTIDTENAEIWSLEAGAGDENMMYFLKGIEIPAENIDKYYNVRTFVKSGDKYSYSAPKTYCPAKLADVFYRSTQDNKEKEIIDVFFKDSDVYFGKDSKKTTFTVFSDFHYMQGMYISSIADMNEIFERAHESGSSFVLSAGDMTNDMKGSPELVNALLNNKYGLTAANVYGNHELESGNSMSDVTKTLTNAQGVVWGTEDGSFDDSIAYYYFEKDGFRIIGTDTNYSWDPTNQIWEHNLPGSWESPKGNTNANSIGPVQLEWLKGVLYDAAEKDIPCIVMSHAAFTPGWGEQSSDAAAVASLFNEVNAINEGTVMMHISGHAHDDRIEYIDGVLHFRANTTRNGFWKATGTDHYGENDTFMMETYDSEGNFLGYVEKKIGELNGGKNTHFTKEALSATVTIDECGIITIEGMNATWINGIEPDLSGQSEYIRPQISNYSTFDCVNGHIWAENYTVDGDVHYKECIHPECTITDVSENAYYAEHEFVDGECVCGKTEAAAIENGDINGDGSVNAGDLAILKKVIAGLTPIDDPEVVNPNVDDVAGLPNAADLAALKKKIAGLV